VKPGEKVRLIEESHEILMQRDWPKVLLVLRQFGFELRERDRWSDEDDYAYLLSTLTDADEGDLLELHQFLRGEDAQPAHRDDDQPWGELPVRAFLSHIHQERYLVGGVKRLLAEKYAVDGFVAHDDIHVSKRWREVIKAGLATCDMFVAFLHPGYHQSQWCDQETGWALARNIPIIVVRPDGTERRDGFLEEHQDFTLPAGNSAEWSIARQIFHTAVTDARTRDAGSKSLVEAFVKSYSYDSTRWLWSIVERVQSFDAAQLRRLEYAVQTNRQVYDANVDGVLVPELVKKLVDRFEPPLAPDPWSAPGPDERPF
jgi:hypothetical protein